jgi:hypothetical protein
VRLEHFGRIHRFAIGRQKSKLYSLGEATGARVGEELGVIVRVKHDPGHAGFPDDYGGCNHFLEILVAAFA